MLHSLCHSLKPFFLFYNYSWHKNIILVWGISCHSFAQKLWLFLDCLQKMFKLLNLGFKAFYISISAYLMFSYTFTTLLNFTVFLKHCLNLIPLFSWYISALNAFLLALFKSHSYSAQFLNVYCKCPLFSQSLSWIGHSAVISSFSGLLKLLTLYAVLLAPSALFCSLTLHTYICFFYLSN